MPHDPRIAGIIAPSHCTYSGYLPAVHHDRGQSRLVFGLKKVSQGLAIPRLSVACSHARHDESGTCGE